MSLTTLNSIVNAALSQARADITTQQAALANLGSLADAKRVFRDATAVCQTALVPVAAEQAQRRLARAQQTIDGYEQRKQSIKGDLARAQKAERSLCKAKYALTGEAAPPARDSSPPRKCSVCKGANHNRATCPAVARSMTAYVPPSRTPVKRKAEVLEAVVLEAVPAQGGAPSRQWQRLKPEIVANMVGRQIRFKTRGVPHDSTIMAVSESGRSITISGQFDDLNNCLNITRKIEVLA